MEELAREDEHAPWEEMMLSVSVMSLWTGLNEASLETTAAAKEDMTGRWR